MIKAQLTDENHISTRDEVAFLEGSTYFLNGTAYYWRRLQKPPFDGKGYLWSAQWLNSDFQEGDDIEGHTYTNTLYTLIDCINQYEDRVLLTGVDE